MAISVDQTPLAIFVQSTSCLELETVHYNGRAEQAFVSTLRRDSSQIAT